MQSRQHVVNQNTAPIQPISGQRRKSWASSDAVRRTMQANRRSDTAPEIAVRHLLHGDGFRYRVDWPLPFDRRRRADIAFTRAKVAIFIDGCYWHGCAIHYVPPKANAEYWREKRRSNEKRDRDTDAQMSKLGWTVLRFWEHDDIAGYVVQTIEDVVSKNTNQQCSMERCVHRALRDAYRKDPRVPPAKSNPNLHRLELRI